jgi:hypothetical protein
MTTPDDKAAQAEKLRAFLKNKHDQAAAAAANDEVGMVADVDAAHGGQNPTGDSADPFASVPAFAEMKTPPMRRLKPIMTSPGVTTQGGTSESKHSASTRAIEQLLREIRMIGMILMAMLAFLILWEIGFAIYETVYTVRLEIPRPASPELSK